MFTGLIEGLGEIVECKQIAGGSRLRIETPLASDLHPGDSLAVNGVCLTVIQSADGGVHAEVGPETFRITTLGAAAVGQLVNLERPVRADGRMGGHFVQGHVDAVGHIEAIRPDSDFHWLTVSFPKHLSPFIVSKGSIAVDGISLTVAGLGADRFDVQIVPFTVSHTNLQRSHIRDRVNLECDMIAKYVVHVAELAGLSLAAVRPGEVTH
jgi:riboflavin synthase